MKVEQAIGIIIGVAIVLVFLFYLVTRYFNYRLQKSLENQNQVYSMVDGMHQQQNQQNQGLFENIAFSKVQEWENQGKKTNFQFTEMSDRNLLKQSLYQQPDSIYSNASFQDALRYKSVPHIPESNRTSRSIKNLGIQKLSDKGTLNSLNNSFQSIKKQQQNTKRSKTNQDTHKYVSKIVKYTNKCIEIVQIVAAQIYKDKKDGQIKQKIKIIKQKIYQENENYLQCLDVFGFQQKNYGAFKYETTYKFPRMSPGKIYQTSALKSTTNKQEIQQQQFQLILLNLQKEDSK